MNPREEVLRHCAESAPEHWHPGERAEHFREAIDQLCAAGLITREAVTLEQGQALRITSLGQRFLDNPEYLSRLRGDRGPGNLDAKDQANATAIRQALSDPPTAYVTRALVFVNVLVFVYGLWLASQQGVIGDYLKGFLGGGQDPSTRMIWLREGAITQTTLTNGDWWRLLTSGFVHLGALHILMNMYVLYSAGKYVESMWGHVRYAVIYFIALWGGSCLAMARTAFPSPDVPLAGASGAICGVLGAEAVWVFLNGKYLPPRIAGQARMGIITTGLLLIFISLIPSVSFWGHLGGAIFGALAALIFQFERFGPLKAPWRWALLLALLPLPVVSYGMISWKMPAGLGSQMSEAQEKKEFTDTFLTHGEKTHIGGILSEAGKAGSSARLLLNLHPTRREQDKVKQSIQVLGEQQEKVQHLVEALEGVGPYQADYIENARKTALAFARNRLRLLELAREGLQAGEDWTGEDEKAFEKQVAKDREARKAWSELVEPADE